MPIPEEFQQRLQNIIPQQHWESVWNSFNTVKPLTLRINTLRTQTEKVYQQLVEAGFTPQHVEWNNDALILPFEQREAVLNGKLYQQGLLYSQNLSSQLAPLLLNPQAGEEILDMCAAPGGKTLQIACLMQDQGRIAAVEKVKARYYKMKANIQHQQSNIITTYLKDSSTLGRKIPNRFDRILLDAPCSSESNFKADQPKSYSHWKLNKIKEMSRKQKSLIYSAIQCLKPNGILLYSTCSFAPEENEAIINHSLKKFGDTINTEKIVPPIKNIQSGITQWQNKKYRSVVENAVRILPNEIMDGFFICKIRKS